ncbi:FBD-like domain family protein [Arabidopsis thaliana]|uniref:FBD-like domain family protein n=1 Tax=Arabidopsis thaliana TaxID=3702 RepID=F4I7Z1_ARATH|nr:FBD-like domain family protein [Arabidopsis thaliana]AEE32616.1 FBD-like domain family protein [Arabidopsis thaliana]|eukprot:NP_683416.1 FBD-like domain family protein [Arabidopsis thaliana]
MNLCGDSEILKEDDNTKNFARKNPDPYPPTGTSLVYLDHLELCLCSTEWWNLLTCILDDAPKLRVLKLKLYRKHCVEYNESMEPWKQPDYVPICLSSYLEIFEWRQYNGEEQEREVAKYILENASRLKKAIFYLESAEKHGILKELECMARGSKKCQLVFD